MRLPMIGQIVVYRFVDGWAPAIILKAHDDTLDLKVFEERDCTHKTGVTQGSDLGNWQWPDIQIEEYNRDITS